MVWTSTAMAAAGSPTTWTLISPRHPHTPRARRLRLPLATVTLCVVVRAVTRRMPHRAKTPDSGTVRELVLLLPRRVGVEGNAVVVRNRASHGPPARLWLN